MTYPLPAGDSDGPVREMYNMMMGHFNGNRATSFFVNVQHPDFGATGRNAQQLNEQPAIQEAIDFMDATYIMGRTLWLPAVSDAFSRSRYYVDSPIRLHSGLSWWAYGARIAASPRFDFVTKFPTDNWDGLEQGIIESYNVYEGQLNGRLAMSRLSLRGGLIEGMERPGSIGAIMNLQQQSTWQGVRINDFMRAGLILGGQQGIFHDFMVTAPKTKPPSAASPYVGIQLGIPVTPKFPASFFWFYGTNIEGCYRAVVQSRAIGANVFRDLHLEGVATSIATEPAYCFHLSQGQLIVDEAWWTAAGGKGRKYGTFLFRDDTASSYHLKDIFVQQSGPPNDEAVFINDGDRKHLIQAWGAIPAEEGIVRHVQEMIGPRAANQPHVVTILHDEGGFTALGSYDSSTPVGEQLPLVRIRPGATQIGHLISWYDKTGVEQFLVTADGMPKLPTYTSAEKPPAAGRQAVMIFDLDKGKVQVSDGATWIDLG